MQKKGLIFTLISFTSNCLRMTVWLAGTSPISLSTFSVKSDTLCGLTSALNFSFNAKNITMYCSFKWNDFLMFYFSFSIFKRLITISEMLLNETHLINEKHITRDLHFSPCTTCYNPFSYKSNYILGRKLKVTGIWFKIITRLT